MEKKNYEKKADGIELKKKRKREKKGREELLLLLNNDFLYILHILR